MLVASQCRTTTGGRRALQQFGVCPRPDARKRQPRTTPWEDAAGEYAALVAAWWKGGYANIEK
jgi:hypothetical protein